MSTVPSPLKSGDATVSPVSYSSTVEIPVYSLPTQPPMAYILPFTAQVVRPDLVVGMSAFLVQVSVAGSYSSTWET